MSVARSVAASDVVVPSPRPHGRDEELDRLRAAVAEHRLVTVLGPGGCGKSALARHLAAEVAATREVIHLDLAGLPPTVPVAEAIGTAARIDTAQGNDLVETVCAALRHRGLFLLIDDAEVAVEGVADFAAALLRSAPSATVLVTSRQPLDITGELRFPLGPLTTPTDEDLEDPGTCLALPAVALLVDRVREHDPDFAPTEADVPYLADIVRDLDGLPLALELAAARIATLGLAEVRDRLAERFDLLTGARRDASPRQRSLEATVSWSYEQLEPGAQRLFERLALFPAGAQLDLVEEVCTDPDEVPRSQVVALLEQLTASSVVVVERTRARPRYRMLETLRAYGLARLDERGELDEWRERLARGFVGLSERMGPALLGDAAAGTSAIRRVDAEIEGYRVAHDWTVAAGRDDLALAMLAPLWPMVMWQAAEVARWMVAVAQRADPSLPGFRPCAAMGALLLLRSNDLEVAKLLGARIQQGVDPDDPAEVRMQRMAEAHELLFTGQVDELDARWDEVIGPPVAGTLDQPYLRAIRAMIAAYAGDRDHALALLEGIPAEPGDEVPLAYALLIRFAWAEARSQWDEAGAIPLYRSLLEFADRVGATQAVLNASTGLGAALGRAGGGLETLEAYGDTIRLLARLGSWHNIRVLAPNIVEFLAGSGDVTGAIRLDEHLQATFGGEDVEGLQSRRLAELRAAWADPHGEVVADARAEAAAAVAGGGADGALVPLALGLLDQARARLARSGSGERVEATFLFTDIVGSTDLIGVIGDEAWSNLRRWHDQALREQFEGHGGIEQDNAGDGFFVAFDDPSRALACAVAIQGRLAEHRASSGFAPQVRIGVHRDTAVQDEGGYRGAGVHLAARVAGAAGPGEVLVTASLAAELGVTGPSRSLELKGIPDPVEVVSLTE